MPLIGYIAGVAAAHLPFAWIGGDPSLDFHNTVSWGRDALSQERFRTAGDVRAWARGAGLDSAGRSGPEGRRVIADARVLRDALHRLLLPLAGGRRPGPRDVAAFGGFLRRAGRGVRLERAPGGFRWSFTAAGDLDPTLAGVVWSAARLLTSPDLSRLRACANPDCGWVFLDRSRRGNRRWCEMRACGNRAKARQYYRRHRAAKVRSRR